MLCSERKLYRGENLLKSHEAINFGTLEVKTVEWPETHLEPVVDILAKNVSEKKASECWLSNIDPV